MEARTRIDLPRHVTRPFEVFVNGIPQTEGTDFEVVGSTLLFAEVLSREGKIGAWRWLRMGLGIAGTYRKNDSIDVVFTSNGRRVVASLAPPIATTPAEPAAS
jgi:hypothetical protein